jgi:uncharacterized protein (TIRG00374 family)
MVKKFGFLVLKILVSLSVIGWIIHSFGLGKIIDTLAKADYRFVGLGITVFVISIFLGSIQWYLMLKNRGGKTRFSKALKLYFTGMFFNNFIFGTVAGDSFKVASLHLSSGESKAGFGATFLDRFAGLTALSVYAVVGGGYLLSTKSAGGSELLPALTALSLFVAILAGLFLLLFIPPIHKLIFTVLDKLPPFSFKDKIRGIIDAVVIDLRKPEDKFMVFTVAIISLVIQAMRISVHIFAAMALGLFTLATAPYFFIIVPITALIMLVPLPFGVKESIAGALFAAAGFTIDGATIMEFLATIIGITGSMAGMYFFISEKWLKR